MSFPANKKSVGEQIIQITDPLRATEQCRPQFSPFHLTTESLMFSETQRKLCFASLQVC